MKILKRNGKYENVSFDKIIYRLKKIQNDKLLGALKTIDADIVAQKVIQTIFDGVSSTELDEEAARIAINITENLEFGKLSGRIIISNMHKNTTECFSQVMENLYNNVDKNNKAAPILADNIIDVIRKNKNILNETIDYYRDYNFDYFGYKTLEKSYLMKINGKLVERPQHLYMRVAVQCHKEDIENVIKTYNLLSTGMFTMASPVMFNSGSRLQNLVSCFLLQMEDSIDGIYKTISDVAKISKVGGGIGINISDIRSKGAIIRGTNGTTDGIIPMLRVLDTTSVYVNQAGKRKGSVAVYISPDHPDILEFLDVRKNQGSEELRARNLFSSMWLSDLFMKQVKIDGDWYLMDPDECPGLTTSYGEDYEKLYWKYVAENKFRKKLKAQEVWYKILEANTEGGTPYLLNKDQINLKNNQKNLGTIKCSNLCGEIVQYSDKNEYACCNLSSIALPKYVELDENKKPFFNHELLYDIAKHIILPMNNIIDYTYYPVPEAELSNKKNRPIGVGVMGLSDVYIKMRLPFESDEAKKLNKEIFETIYFALLTGSMELAKKDGPYKSFKDSPFSEGKLQFDLWAEVNGIDLKEYLSGKWDWDGLKKDIIKYGTRNSLLTCCQPTASSAQILGHTESTEPFDSCLFKRRVLSGEYMIGNKYLIEDLTKLKLWNKEMKNLIIANNGSVQDIDSIPDNIKSLYKTVWEIKMANLIDQYAERSVFIDQTQSMNLFMANPTNKKLTSMYFYSFEKGLKTIQYYLRSKSSSTSAKFTIDPLIEKKIKEKQTKGKSLSKKEKEVVLACSRENPESCALCE